MNDNHSHFLGQSPQDRSSFAMLIPKRISVLSSFSPLSLTRRQRIVYFLVDDQRTIAHIASCCNKTATEVEFILAELQDVGLITF